MLEMKITITAADLTSAINNLAHALTQGKVQAAPVVPQPLPMQPPANTTAVPAPVLAPPSIAAAPNASVVPAAPPVVPTAAPSYTLEMIATAGSSLIDAGKLDALVALLNKYGVASLTNLAPEHYGAVAMELRALGARL